MATPRVRQPNFSFLESQTDIVSAQLAMQAGVSTREFLEQEIKNFKRSRARWWMLTGERYYRGHHDILSRKHTIKVQETEYEVTTMRLNNIVDNRYSVQVDTKTDYLFGKPFIFASENEEYAERVKDVYDAADGPAIFYDLGEDAYNHGIAWLYPYYGDQEPGVLKFMAFPGYEILPFWADRRHTKLDMAIRIFELEGYSKSPEGIFPNRTEVAEIYTRDGIFRYTLVGDVLMNELPPGMLPWSPYFYVWDEDMVNAKPWRWDRVPLVPFKGNKHEIPVIKRCKGIQDAINEMLSIYTEVMGNNPYNTLLVVVGYEGQNLAELRHNLATYGIVNVKGKQDEIGEGKVDTLSVDVNAANFDNVLQSLRDALVVNARGMDAKDERLASGRANTMNIESMYAQLDSDANGTERQFQESIKQLMYFIDTHLGVMGIGSYAKDKIEVQFDRDILVDENSDIENAIKLAPFISERSLLERIPGVTDVDAEIERLEKEREEEERRRTESLSSLSGTTTQTAQEILARVNASGDE